MTTKLKDKVWKTADGTELEISKMETYHIENCIKFLQRRINFVESEFIQLLSYPLPMGEIACDSVETGLAEYSYEKDEIVKNLEKKIKQFNKELKRRIK
jgi:hypothetical protein